MKRILSILLCLCLLASGLTGCGAVDDPQAYVPTGDALVWEDSEEEIAEIQDNDQKLSLAYYSNRSMNPLSSSDYTNRVVQSLIYQGLFTVNRNYEVEPVLCSSYTVTADLMTYEFRIDTRATFSDGVSVTAEDVARVARSLKLHTEFLLKGVAQ